jgi:class 3 adenylate cyclase
VIYRFRRECGLATTFSPALISFSDEGHAFQQQIGIDTFVDDSQQTQQSWLTTNKVDPLHTFDNTGTPSLVQATGPYLPRWQTSPVLRTSVVNEDLFLKEGVGEVARTCIEYESAVLGGFVTAPAGPSTDPNPKTAFFATLRSMWEDKQVNYLGDPMAHLHIPIFDRFNSTERKVVAVLKSVIHWRAYFRKILPPNVNGITVVLHNECEGHFTYEIRGDEAYVVGFGDQHDRKFDEYERTGTFTTDTINDGTAYGIKLHQEGCPYAIHVYPTEKYYSSFITSLSIIIALSVAIVFVFITIMFLAYDRLVERRQKLVLAKATQSTSIVSSLFPRQVRDRLVPADNGNTGALTLAPNHRLKTFLDPDIANVNQNNSQPIADLFVNCTVFFADISGFTAWSSTREPTQVFELLQTVYQAFDALAKRRKVFKVETIGDSYVAVTGLPKPQANHAIIMARFAHECLLKFGEVTKELEVALGPDTGELSMRLGLHSGPVTAGVLRGDRARFQLFGDTVNTGKKSRLQLLCSYLVLGSSAQHLVTYYYSPQCSIPNGKHGHQGQDSDFASHC